MTVGASYVLNQYDVLFVNGSDEIAVFTREQRPYGLEGIGILLVLGFNKVYDSLSLCFNVKFLGPVVDVYQKQVVKEKTLYEVVLVITLTVSSE